MKAKAFIFLFLFVFLVLAILFAFEVGIPRKAQAQTSAYPLKYHAKPFPTGQEYFYFEVPSDHTWKMAVANVPKNWYEPEFDDSGWENAVELPYEGPPYHYSFGPGCRITALDWHEPTVFFRRKIGWHWHFPDLNRISRVTLMVGADDDVAGVYFNGEKIGEENTDATGPFLTFDVTDFWKDHENNCIAIQMDNEVQVGWLYCVMRVYIEPYPNP